MKGMKSWAIIKNANLFQSCFGVLFKGLKQIMTDGFNGHSWHSPQKSVMIELTITLKEMMVLALSQPDWLQLCFFFDNMMKHMK
jgi:hypothetical protein